MTYTQVIRGLLDQKYPDIDSIKTIVITIQLHLLPAPVKPLFLRYKQLEILVLSKCDLRNLQNFPKIDTLKWLDLSENSLQGSLNNLMPLSCLTYLNISKNLINDFHKLQPLQMIDNLEVFLAGNPFLDGDGWKTKFKHYGIKILKESKVLETSVKIKEQEKKEEKKAEQPSFLFQPPSCSEGNPRLHRRPNSFLFEIRARRQRLQEEVERKIMRRISKGLSDDSQDILGFHEEDDNQEIDIINDEQPEQSDELNDEDDDSEHEDNQNDPNFDQLLGNEFQPIFQAFQNQNLEIEDENEEEDEDEPSEEQSQT